MSNRPLVEVTGNARRWAPSGWRTSFALRILGAIPRRISVKHSFGGESLDAIIVGSGNDIGPEQYGGELAARVKLDPDRDQLEINRIKQALDDDTPLLGICRGAQLINVVMGGSLHRAIRSRRVHMPNLPSLLAAARVALDSPSVLARIFGRTRVQVNTFHHQAIREPRNGLRVLGRDRDDIVQAIESDAGISIIGLQWHPEYLFYLPTQLALFRWLLFRADR
jgi:putative glutamine amidotransferase